jgi:hypothetical protein
MYFLLFFYFILIYLERFDTGNKGETHHEVLYPDPSESSDAHLLSSLPSFTTIWEDLYLEDIIPI